MVRIKNIVILTCSSKHHGYCVAGIDMGTGKMIRLVTNNQSKHGALTRDDLIASNGIPVNPLNVVEVPILCDKPLKTQPENILIDKTTSIKYLKKVNLSDVMEIRPLDNHEYIFGNNNCFLTEKEIFNINHSLVMVEVSNLKIYCPYNKTKADFYYNGVHYTNLSVTDSKFYNSYTHREYDKAILVISLPDTPWDGCGENRYYKFVSKIFI